MDKDRVEAFRVLGIPTDSAQDAVAHAYRRLARATHPDVSSDPGAADRFATVAAAYRLLSADPSTTSIAVRVAASPPEDERWAAVSVSGEGPREWDLSQLRSWAMPVAWQRARRRRESPPIVAGPAWVSPLRGRDDDTEVRGG